MILQDKTDRPDTIMESLFRQWYAEKITKEIYDEMDCALFPEDVLILRMAERFEEYMEEKQCSIVNTDLIAALENYIDVLSGEVSDSASFLHVHNWKSKRIQDGIEARERIQKARAKAQLTTNAWRLSGKPSNANPQEQASPC